jgi:uncharacterized protein (TIGR02246 family)
MKKTLISLLFVSLMLAAAPLQAADHGLMHVDSAWVKAMRANDAEACAALYAEDAVLVLPGTGPIKGRKAIGEAYAGWLEMYKVTDVSITDGEYRSAGAISTGWGAWSMTTVPRAGGAAMTATGTWCAVAVQENGQWKYIADHASENPPPSK